ncbi:hypothetical protein Ccrd_003081, partial [Cynara cardunculus var. scolymus]
LRSRCTPLYLLTKLRSALPGPTYEATIGNFERTHYLIDFPSPSLFAIDRLYPEIEPSAYRSEFLQKWIERMHFDLNFQLPEGSLDEPGTNDVFSKAMGKDKHGSARTYGLDVRGSDIWGVLPSRFTCYRENMLWKRAYKDVSNEVAKLKAMVLEMRGSNENISSTSSVPVTSINRPKATTGLQPLKSIINSMEIVARGRVKSLDPDELVGGEEIGPNWCE